MKTLTYLAQIASMAVLASPVSAATTYLKAINTRAGSQSGYSVAVAGDTIVVGAPGDDRNADGTASSAGSGSAYVFVRSEATWRQEAHLKASSPVVDAQFGFTVVISGETIVVGAPGESGDAGAAYVFLRTGANWDQEKRLQASNAEAGDRFGVSVGADGNTVVVGAQWEDGGGAAYVFVRTGVNWDEQDYVKGSTGGGLGARFGSAVAVAGNTIVVGAPGDLSGSFFEDGSAFVFVRSGTTWSQQQQLDGRRGDQPLDNVSQDDVFGTAVAISGETIVVGAPGDDSDASGINGNESNANSPHSGAAYVFTRSGSVWTRQAYLKASNAESRDRFGQSVAVSGDTVVVGAQGEDDDGNTAFNSGAAYVFSGGTIWSQKAYLKAPNPGGGRNQEEEGDHVGFSVAVSSGTIVAGAPREDSNATSVDGDQNNNNALEAGAGYVFTVSSSGPSTGPEIVVEQPAGTPLSDGVASVDFGIVIVGSHKVLTFTIKNAGDADLTGLGITIDGPNFSNFKVTANPGAPVVSPGGSATFTVDFTPLNRRTASVQHSAALHLTSNDSDENPFDITLRALGVEDVCKRLFCVVEFIFCLGTPFDFALQAVPQNAPTSLSLGHFYALESLMNQTGEGRRLTGLYWQFTREVVQIAIANPALALEASQVLLDFQPAVSALLSGKGSSVQITPAMIDQLNRAWTGLANVASPALKTALETERARFNGFQAFVGKNFSEWAGLLQVPVPAQPYIQAFNPTQQKGRFRVGANYILGMAYSLWKSVNPASAAWTPVPDASVQVGAYEVELTDTNASPSALFYKVRAQEAISDQ